VKKVLTQILQGTLDLMILRTLATMGPQHAYGIANRLLQISDDNFGALGINAMLGRVFGRKRMADRAEIL
jgi:hypothetical protein